MDEARTQRRAAAALFLGASIWGLYWIPLRELHRMGIEGAWAVVFFNFCPLLVLVPLLIWGRRWMLVRPLPTLFIGATTGIGLGLYSTSIVLAPVIRMTMEFYLTSVWSTIIGVIWLSEQLGKRRLASVAAGLTGLYLLLSGASGEQGGALSLGDVLAVSSGILWALGAAGMKRWPDAHVAATSTIQFLFAVAAGGLLAILLLPNPAPDFAAFVQAFPLAFFPSTLLLLPSIYAIFWACRVLFPGRAAILMMSEALVATLSASWLLPAETMSALQWAGAFIVLMACLLGQ